MRYSSIPNTDLLTSSISLGTAILGSNLDEEKSFQLLDKFFELGGNFLDTAHIYADWIPGERGRSEKTIGRWIQERGLRDKIIIGTKGGHSIFTGKMILRLSREEIKQDLNESLEYLQTNYIDLYWLHRDDPDRAVGDILETLNELVETKKIRYFGCSNWKVHRIREAMEYAYKHGLKCFAANQIMWSLAAANINAIEDKTMVVMDQECMALHKETGLAAVPYSSQAQGFFTKMNNLDKGSLDQNTKRLYDNEKNTCTFKKLKQLELDLGVNVTDIALSYLISQSFVTIPIVGCRTIDQLTESLKAADLVLKPEIVNYLSE